MKAPSHKAPYSRMPLPTSSCLRRCAILVIAFLHAPPLAVLASHNAEFWKTIVEHNFAVPPSESPGTLALEIADLAAETDPVLRDKCGYEILVAWVYRDNLVGGEQLEALRRKLLPGMVFHIGESESDTVFRRSFSALYMSILAAEDLRKPFLSETAFKETLNTALRCYANERDLRGYVPDKGWAHATAHVADLLKFLARNRQLSAEDQKRIVAAVSQRCRTASSVFSWGEDSRMAGALLSVVERKDFDDSAFKGWFKTLVAENEALWKAPTIATPAYVSVRAQTNVLAHLAAKIAAQKDNETRKQLRDALNATLSQIN
jgi:Protein of unknown function (DUF2785)